MTGFLFGQFGVGQHVWAGRPSLSRKVSHAMSLFVCSQGPVVMSRLLSRRVLVSHVFVRSMRSGTSSRSGRRMERVWIVLCSVFCVVHVFRSVEVKMPSLYIILPCWKGFVSEREAASVFRCATESGCVCVQLKDWVERRLPACRSSGLWEVSSGRLARTVAAVSMFVAHMVRWAVYSVPDSVMIACGHLAFRFVEWLVGFG